MWSSGNTDESQIPLLCPPAGNLESVNELLCYIGHLGLQSSKPHPPPCGLPGETLGDQQGVRLMHRDRWLCGSKCKPQRVKRSWEGLVLQRMQSQTRRTEKNQKREQSGLTHQEHSQGQDYRKGIKNLKSGSCWDESKTKSVGPQRAVLDVLASYGCDQFAERPHPFSSTSAPFFCVTHPSPKS